METMTHFIDTPRVRTVTRSKVDCPFLVGAPLKSLCDDKSFLERTILRYVLQWSELLDTGTLRRIQDGT